MPRKDDTRQDDASRKRDPERQDLPEAGPGAGDASSGGGAGAGIPGGGTDMRTAGSIPKGDVKKDRERIFPESTGPKGERDEAGGPAPKKGDPPHSSTHTGG